MSGSADAPEPSAAVGGYRRVVADGDFGSGSLVQVDAGEHRWTLDLAPSFGGPGSEADPVTAFLGSLSGCLLMSLQLTASRRRIPVAGASMVASCNPKGYVTSIAIELRVRTSAPDDDVARLVEGAERACFVRQLLGEHVSVTIDVSTERPA